MEEFGGASVWCALLGTVWVMSYNLGTIMQELEDVSFHSYNYLSYFLGSNMWPAERKPSTSRKYWIWVRGNFIRTGRFPAKLRLLHQRVTGGLYCIMLNYEAWLCYYSDDISSNSQAGQWNTGTRCYGQLVRVLQKTRFYQLPVGIRLSFCP